MHVAYIQNLSVNTNACDTSPFVSGVVYSIYLFYIIQLVVKQLNANIGDSCFPNCWQRTSAGRIGLVLVSI